MKMKMKMTAVKILKGPWVAVVASSGPDDPDVDYAIPGDGFESRQQADAFLRHEFPREWRMRRAFPLDARTIAKPEHKIGEFKTESEARDFVERIAVGPKVPNTKQ
jgi:hypothetical protein